MKRMLESIRKWSPLALAFSFIIHSLILFSKYRDYASYQIEYETSKSRLFSLYRQGEDVDYIQSQVAYLKATAGMRSAELTQHFWETLYVMVPITIMYMFIYSLSLIIKDPPKDLEPHTNKEKEVPYMSGDVGETLYDDRNKKDEPPGVH